jgi:hypothetical protein
MIATIALVAAGFWIVQEHQQIRALNAAMIHQRQKLYHRLAEDEQLLATTAQEASQVSQPTDPLSAYNQVCSQPLTDSLTGVTSTWYLPCTNSAQTIPQPGG